MRPPQTELFLLAPPVKGKLIEREAITQLLGELLIQALDAHDKEQNDRSEQTERQGGRNEQDHR